MRTYEHDKYILPVWEGDIVYYETVLFVGEEDVAPLLYPIKDVLGVYDYGLQIEYKNGVDFSIVDGKIKRLKGGNLPFMKIDEYYLEQPAQHTITIVNRQEKAPEGKKYFAFGEKDSFSKYQVAITYRHEGTKHIEKPVCKRERFNGFHTKLKNGQPVSLTFYGDSITVGCNSSGTPMGGETPPFADKFSIMVTKAVQGKFSSAISHYNCAVGGWSSKNGIDNFEEKVLVKKADLFVLAFGMNDGATEPSVFLENTENMVKSFRKNNPSGEVLLISTTLPNTESDWLRNQPLFAEQLFKLEDKYSFVSVADMTDMHKKLLATGKRYRDMTGNNVNHPNDFLARIYAQVILQTIIG